MLWHPSDDPAPYSHFRPCPQDSRRVLHTPLPALERSTVDTMPLWKSSRPTLGFLCCLGSGEPPEINLKDSAPLQLLEFSASMPPEEELHARFSELVVSFFIQKICANRTVFMLYNNSSFFVILFSMLLWAYLQYCHNMHTTYIQHYHQSAGRSQSIIHMAV